MEFLNNLFSPFKERLKSHLYGALFFSWIICNWRIITLILTDTKYFGNSADLKVSTISQYLDLCKCDNWPELVILPLFFTAIYLFCFPLIDRLIYKYRNKIERKKLNDKLELIRKEGYSQNEYIELFDQYQALDKKIKNASDNVSNKINEYLEKSKSIENLEKINRELMSEKTELNRRIEAFISTIDAFNYSHLPNNCLKGSWTMAINQKDTQILLKEIQVSFENNHLKNLSTSKLIAEIVFFSYNPTNKSFQIVLKNFNPIDGISIGNIACKFDVQIDDNIRIKYVGNIKFLGAETIGSSISLIQLK